MSSAARISDNPLKHVCRGCLLASSPLRPLFGHQGQELADKFSQCAALKIAKNDGFPQHICEPCTALLNAAYMFRQIAAKSDQEMRSMAPDVLIKDERADDMVEHYLESQADEGCSYVGDNEYTAENTNQDEEDISCSYLKTTGDMAMMEIKIEAAVDDIPSPPNEMYIKSPKKQIELASEPLQPVKLKQRKSRALLPRIHQCDLCGATSKTMSGLRDHRNTHFPPENPLICDFCEKQFRDKRSIIMHLRTHTGERPYVCEQCGKAFKTAPAIHRHQSVHTGVRNFPCMLCTYRAGTRANLAIHERIHTGVQPFACPKCPQKFSTVSNQKKHIRSMHDLSDEFMCNCGRRCSSSAMLRQHINQHLGLKPYECPSCTMKYSFYTALIKHARIHHPDVQLPKEGSYEKPVFDPEALKQLANLRKDVQTGETCLSLEDKNS